jgi:hypothetical protein
MEDFEMMGDVEEPVWRKAKPKPKKAASPPAPAGDMHSLADVMKKKLASVNISTDLAAFPHVEFPSDFGDCELSFSDTKQAEIKIKCVVEKGYESVARLNSFTQKVRDALEGECAMGGHNLRTRHLRDESYSGAGKRYSTLFMSVVIR